MFRDWDDLPDFMKVAEVRPYWEALNKKRFSICMKRVFDITAALILLVLLAVPMLIIALLIRADSPGPAIYRQQRATAYGKRFRIHKFRTMVADADKIGSAVTVNGDARVTRIGKKLRDRRLDELPQLFDVLAGNMSFVGVRPEADKYVGLYRPEYNATFLLPAGITSKTSILFSDEAKLLEGAQNPDKKYIEEILPQKMSYNLDYIKNFSLKSDFDTLIKTLGVLNSKG